MVKIKVNLRYNSYYIFLQHNIFDNIVLFHKKYYTDCKAIIITDHNVKEALSIVDYGYIIYNGEIIKSGSPKDITSDNFVKKNLLRQELTLIGKYLIR